MTDLAPLLSDSDDTSAPQTQVTELSNFITEVAGWDLTSGIQSTSESKDKGVIGQDFDDENECNEEDDEVPDFIRDLETSCQCLMDLVPSIEQAIQQMRQDSVEE